MGGWGANSPTRRRRRTPTPSPIPSPACPPARACPWTSARGTTSSRARTGRCRRGRGPGTLSDGPSRRARVRNPMEPTKPVRTTRQKTRRVSLQRGSNARVPPGSPSRSRTRRRRRPRGSQRRSPSDLRAYTPRTRKPWTYPRTSSSWESPCSRRWRRTWPPRMWTGPARGPSAAAAVERAAPPCSCRCAASRLRGTAPSPTR
mmetsp:Transcript_5024/g.20522  ORF Transcript_5024/g.20522 Transcript_5024/m.20522 type:complete len:203 (-) Transcript_5024:852-1460(-)